MGSLLRVDNVFAQQVQNVDAAFQEARELAFEGKYRASRQLSRQILAQVPDYHDVRVLLARTYAWDNSFRNARTELSYVLERDPENIDALSARIDVERWSGNYRTALQFANQAILLSAENPDLYVTRALILTELNQYSIAIENLNTADRLDPNRDDVRTLRETIRNDQQRNMIVAGLTRDDYNVDLDSRERLYFEYHRLTNHGPIIGRVNIDHRFETVGYQFELDAYPRFSNNWYSYLNVGYSSSILFPEFRAGLELYRVLPRGFEASIGARFLQFDKDDVLIYTGSLSKYWRAWFFTMRPFLTPRDSGLNAAFNFIARRYFGNPETYASFIGGVGFSPDERRLLDSTFGDRFSQSYYFGLTGNRKIRNNFQLFGEFRWTFQELQAFPGFTQIYTLETGVRYQF